MNNKVRKSNIELLRILAMFLIVFMHLLWHGNVLNSCDYGSINYYLFWSIRSLCYISVNVFVLISGYFMIYSKFNNKKLFKMILQTLFYSLVFFSISSYINKDIFTIFNLLKSIFPISSGVYWYITSYVLLYLISPLLNNAIISMDKNELRRVIIYLFIAFSIFPTFLFWSRSFLSMGRDLNWFIFLYLVGGYIRKYNISCKNKKLLFIFIISIFLMIISLVLIGAITHLIFGRVKEQDLMLCFNSIFSLCASISVFLIFLNIRINNMIFSRIVNSISKLVIGVYLFHENPFFRDILWGIINPTRFINSSILTLLYSIFACIMIMMIGCLIEKCRLYLLKCFHIG